MSFTSLSFVIFLALVFAIYYICPAKYRWITLLISNYVFYAFAGIQYILVLLYVSALAYFAGRHLYKVERINTGFKALMIVLTLAPLVVFKYTGFLAANVNIILKAMHSAVSLSTMQIALPLGISFYTFSALGYVIDMSRKKYEPYANPLHLATGVSFFPCLVSGPIERQNKLVPQLLAGKAFDYTMATYGLKQIAWGLFEKKVIADNLAVYVDKVFDDMDYWTGAPLLVGSLFFTIQIYCDFAGYSDIALGVAKLFGIELTKNFDSPYFSKSLQEFWRRWHISLSSWFRDYVYIPLGGNRKGDVRKNINVIITMLVSGIWHGAAWTFIAWGGIHGLIQALENVFGLSKKKTENKLVNFVRAIVVFLIVNALWVFFRANSFVDAWYLFAHQFDGIASVGTYVRGLIPLGINPFVYTMIPIIFELIILFIHDYLALKMDVINELSAKPVVVRWLVYVLFILMVLLLSAKGGAVKFVYAGF